MYNAPESIGSSLESGKQVTVNLQLKSEEVVPEEPVWWVEGVQPSDQWEYEAPVYRMPWRQNCGWFDCNKLDARDTSPTGDGKTCWEASSSNLMHWWLNANRSYVERYLEYKRRLNPEFRFLRLIRIQSIVRFIRDSRIVLAISRGISYRV